MVSESLPEDMAYEMDKALEDLLSPEKVSEKVLEGLLANDKSVSLTSLFKCSHTSVSLMSKVKYFLQ